MSSIDTLAEALRLTGADTPVHPASDIKTQWSRIVDSAMRHGEVIVTHHRRPEVVVVDIRAYGELVRRAEANSPLKNLQAEFDRRFAALDGRAADTKLRRIAATGIPPPSRKRKPARRKPG